MVTDNAASRVGYYKYTDIVFHYPRAIEDPDEASVFKQAIHHSALGNRSHPLWTNEEKGLVLYIGSFPNGQSRLMFSSAQIEYMRYLLNATGLTKKPLPLPASEYLLTESQLKNISTVYLKSPTEVKKAYEKVKKNSRKSKNDAMLSSYRQKFDKVRDLYASKKGSWLAIDIEAWTVSRSAITEFGWAYVRRDSDKELWDQGHYIVKKNKALRNGQYVRNAQDRYAFGISEELETTDFKKAVRELIIKFQETGPLFLIFHDYRQDIEFLKTTEYFGEGLTSTFVFDLPKGIPDEGTFIVDTSELFSALEGDVHRKRSLGDMCKLLRIETQHLHNAGNDAHYTLLALMTMASGNQVDAQREDRWPGREMGPTDTNSHLRVIHLPEDEDSDFSPVEDDDDEQRHRSH